MNGKEVEKIAVRTSVVTIIVNALLTVFKFVAGIFGHSLAMISDAIHSASDVLSTVIVIIGIKVSAKAADKDHEFGHERYECVAAILLAGLLFATGAGIGYGGITNIIDGSYKTATLPDYLALSAAIASIVVKEAMFWYTWAPFRRSFFNWQFGGYSRRYVRRASARQRCRDCYLRVDFKGGYKHIYRRCK